MTSVQVAGGTEIDCCDQHGVWLDVGELQAIVSHYESPARGNQGLAGEVGRTLLDSAARGAGFGAGASLARNLIQKLLG